MYFSAELEGWDTLQFEEVSNASDRIVYNTVHYGMDNLRKNIQEEFYSGKNNTLQPRTGKARDGWKLNSTIDSDGFTIVIKNEVPYADHSKKRTIRPRSTKFLAVPLDAAKNSNGVPYWESPIDSPLDLFFIKSKQNPTEGVLVHAVGKSITPYYALKKQVTIPARTKGLMPYALRELKNIGTDISNKIERAYVNR